MEFTQYTCPVCGNRFENGDDVVVCPECGAPHHRECWEKHGRCFYAERHGEGFSFEDASNGGEENGEAGAETVVCQRCGAENEKTNFYCGTCGYPMHAEDRTEQTNAQQTQNQPPYSQGMPFGFGATGNPMYDPMAGMNSEEEIAEGVKVGEAAKYIGKNTPYYLQVFRRIRQFGSGKFNFSAFLFTGGYFLYRKMYVPGVLLMLARIGIAVGSTALALSNSWMGTMQYSECMSCSSMSSAFTGRKVPRPTWRVT
jgi:ribosomal protein L37E